MDTRGAPEDFLFTALFNDMMYGIHTCITGKIVSFDATKNLATVQPTVRSKFVQEGTVKYLDPPPIQNVPVVLPASVGGGLFITVPIKENDPCLIVFAQRSIDNVVQLGGIQNPVDGDEPRITRLRHHDMTDAICIPSITLVPNAIANWSQTAIEIRNASKTVCVSVTPSTVNITSPTVNITSPTVNITSQTVTVNATTVNVPSGDVIASGVSLKNHVHGGVTGGVSNTGVPVV